MKAVGLISVLSAIVYLVIASPAPVSLVAGYTLAPAVWAAPDGTIFNGTVQELNVHLETRNRLSARDGVEGRITTWRQGPPITVYDDEYIKWDGPICGEHKEKGHHWPGARQTDTAFNIEAIASVQSGESWGLLVHHGPKMCAMIACRFGAAVFWCNDYDHPIQVLDGTSLAAATKVLAEDCKYSDKNGDFTMGQTFSNTHKFNIIVHAQHQCQFWNKRGSTMPGEGSADWGDV